jgi:hypothetical protein
MLKVALPFLAAALAASAALAQQPPPGPSPREACKGDYHKLCKAGEKPRDCFEAHKDQLSDVCKEAIVRSRAAQQSAGGGAPNPN